MKTTRWLTQKEAAEYIGVSVTTLAKWRQRGNGPPWSAAFADPRYSLERLDQYMTEAEVYNSVEAQQLRKGRV
jgi:transcriptional regulator with XRE-family HTH domain